MRGHHSLKEILTICPLIAVSLGQGPATSTSSLPLRFVFPAVLVTDNYFILLVWQSQDIAVDLCFSAFENSSACLPSSRFHWLKSTPEARHQTSSYSLCGVSVCFSFQGRVGEMVLCQIWCVSKPIPYRLTLRWLRTKPMKINKSTRSYFYLLYSAYPLIPHYCLSSCSTF